ncbi:MAG: trehalose-phosphatase [Proteobacteria bacterium]|nr:trehalose-phosphatase [Pseudomonadota bacterium]
MKLPVPLPASPGLFLDVDGTLIEFSPHPSQTRAPRALVDLLQRIEHRLQGAVALISGRPIADLDAIFFPLRLRAAGVHGGERREQVDQPAPHSAADPTLNALRAGLHDIATRHPGIEIEDKRIAVAVHYRTRPEARAPLLREIAALLGGMDDGVHLIEGNLVIEVKPRRFTKADAIATFLEQPVFAQRTPVFLGDDITDLDGFRLVEARGGLSVAVGERVDAQWRLADPAATRAWLGELVTESCAS